ncbi:peroxidase family protein [Hyalangium gracile]|uniref:peroxidase family protein n=1 Tax=Hyalangium gracile TaxID=394092 RepID=UPI001CC9FFC6|nr:peroxidase family protein [Hyalangium gracile]
MINLAYKKREYEAEVHESDELDPAIALLERGNYLDAVVLLKARLADRPTASDHGLLGTTYLLMELYEDAKQQLELALEKDPDSKDWTGKLQKAMEGSLTGVNVQVPEMLPFHREELLAPPEDPNLPSPPPPRPATPAGWLYSVVGKLVGKIVDTVKQRQLKNFDDASMFDGVWTNWYRKRYFEAILTLAYMRERLDHHNLYDTYPEGELTAFQAKNQTPPQGVTHFRTADGSWNNLDNPKEGAAGVRFPRNVAQSSTWPRADLLTPNPAEISQVLLARRDEGMLKVPFLNLLAGAWIQFMVHDWVSHRMGSIFGIHEIPLPEDHPARKKYHQTKMFVGKTAPDPTRARSEAGVPPTYINEVTSWWDGSQIYGSDQKTAQRLRTLRDGKLRLTEQGLLPVGRDGIEETGYNRNWWLGLGMLHTLFTREHNAICDMLKARYPAWDDNRLYNVARLINAAVMAKIHTVEWTPAILPNSVLYDGMNANWYGMAETLLRSRKDRRTLPPLKIASPEVGGIVGNATEKFGVPYGLSEEFTEVYRLHELLPDTLELRRIGSSVPVEHVPLAMVRQSGVHKLTARVRMEDLFFSFGNMHPGQLVLNNYPNTLRELSLPGNPMYDLAAVDILRARERGVPPYNEFRRQLGLQPIRTFEDLTSDQATLAALKRIYRSVEEIDLLVGNRAEAVRPDHFGFGETLFHVFILNASRRLQADRFFTENYNAETYTPEGLRWVDESDMKAVLLRQFPALGETGLANVINAFEPWDTEGADIGNPARHPLHTLDR